MSTITFDTREFIHEPKNIGFSEEQAEIIAKLHKAAGSSTLESWGRGFMMSPPRWRLCCLFLSRFGGFAKALWWHTPDYNVTLRYTTSLD